MALLNVVLGDQSLGVIGLEANVDTSYITEAHETKQSVTQYPVESGSNLIDHSQSVPDKLTLTGVVSSIANVSVTRTRGSVFSDDQDAPRRGWYALNQMMKERRLVTAITLLGSYSNMQVRKLKADVSEATGANLLFTMELQEVTLLDELSGLGIPKATTGDAADRQATQTRGRVGTKTVTAGDANEAQKNFGVTVATSTLNTKPIIGSEGQ